MKSTEFTSGDLNQRKGPPQNGTFCGAGQNARLAAKLTGFKIDIRPESAPDPVEEEVAEAVEE